MLKCQEKIPLTIEFEVAQEKFFLSECLKSNWKDCVKSYIVSTLWEEYTGSIKSVVEFEYIFYILVMLLINST